MNNPRWKVCTLIKVEDNRNNDGIEELLLAEEQQRPKAIERALEDHPPVPIQAAFIENTEEVIKVYLESRKEKEVGYRQLSVRMLTDDVSQIQEVRYCLKTLREQMATRQSNSSTGSPAKGVSAPVPTSKQPVVPNGNIVDTESQFHVKDSQEESVRLREVTKRLYAQLKEADRKHKEEKHRLQAESGRYQKRLEEQTERLQQAESKAKEKGQHVEELQRILGGLEMESNILKDKMAAREADLQKLKEEKKTGQEKEKRSEMLEKEVAILKEKIHQLDDMLKSQQRKVRHMIEQLQNSRTVMQERSRHIGDLEEKVAFLEAENRELHDHMEYLLEGQSPATQTINDNKPQVIYSEQFTPTSPTNKSLPFIKVIEIKS